ncbi:MAG TPA: LysR substrate-binding domain-containing protein [Burkholderiales bacterium]|nr:LysR substrate-binding domain-containing protein [Burkholderiales bacterium]
MRLNQIRDFMAIVEAGSIRAAARSLALTQPALTKSLRQLETELGAVLVTRGVRGARPTEIGCAFLARARAVTVELQRARDEIDQLRGGRAGSLAVGSAPGPALGLLPEALARLRIRWREAKVCVTDISPSEVLPALREGRLDAALSVRIGPLAEPGPECIVEPLYRNEARIVARRGHPLGTARSLTELAGAEWVRTGGTDNTSLLPAAFRVAGVGPPRYRIECRSFFALAEIVAQSDLLAVVPWQLAARESAAGRVVELPVSDALPAREICLFTRADIPLTPIAREFVDVLREAARRVGPAAGPRLT